MNLPVKWSDISLGQFIELHELSKREGIEPYERELQTIAIVSGEDYTTLSKSMKLSEIIKTAEKLKFLGDTDQLPKTFPETFKIEGKKYRVNKYVNTFKFGEYVDINTYLEKGMLKLHHVMSIICKPVNPVWKKETQTDEERAQLFYDHLPITIAQPVSVFFFQLWTAFIPYIETSLRNRIQTMNEELIKELRASLTDGPGIELLTRLQGETGSGGTPLRK